MEALTPFIIFVCWVFSKVWDDAIWCVLAYVQYYDYFVGNSLATNNNFIARVHKQIKPHRPNLIKLCCHQTHDILNGYKASIVWNHYLCFVVSSEFIAFLISNIGLNLFVNDFYLFFVWIQCILLYTYIYILVV